MSMKTKYIDAEKLYKEIDGRMVKFAELEKETETDDMSLSLPTYYQGKRKMCSEILTLIDSLQQEQVQTEEYGPYARQYPQSKVSKEQPEVDLEKEMDSYFNEHFSPCVDGTLISERTGMEIDGNDYDDIARHFYELGLNARKEE